MKRKLALLTVRLICLYFFMSYHSVLSDDTTDLPKSSTTTEIIATTTKTTTTVNTSTPSIESVTIGNNNRIVNIKWKPNRVTTSNTRYKIYVINKNTDFPLYEYPGTLTIIK